MAILAGTVNDVIYRRMSVYGQEIKKLADFGDFWCLKVT